MTTAEDELVNTTIMSRSIVRTSLSSTFDWTFLRRPSKDAGVRIAAFLLDALLRFGFWRGLPRVVDARHDDGDVVGTTELICRVDESMAGIF